MKILHVINNLSSGGAEKIIDELIPIINKYEKIDVEVLLLSDTNNVFFNNLINANVKVTVIPYRKIYSPLNIIFIRNFIVKGRFDIIHSHLFPTNYWVALASRLIFLNKPTFLTTEHSTHNKRRDKKFLRLIEYYIYNSYEKIISISEEVEYNLVNWLKFENKINKFIVINNGVNLEKIREAKSYLKSEFCSQFDDSTILICMVGRFALSKDQQTIIKSLKQLPDNLHLLLVGEGSLLDASKQLAHEIGVSERVHFLGFRSDVHEILKSVDIVILSSVYEGFGLAAIEGMAAGKPVVASDVPGLNSIVKNAGLLFTCRNVDELSQCVKKLIKDVGYYEKICLSCEEKSSKYSIEKMAENYLQVYKGINTRIGS